MPSEGSIWEPCSFCTRPGVGCTTCLCSGGFGTEGLGRREKELRQLQCLGKYWWTKLFFHKTLQWGLKAGIMSSPACCGCCLGFWGRTSPSVAILVAVSSLCGNRLCLYQWVKRGLVGSNSILWSSPLLIPAVLVNGASSSSSPGNAGGWFWCGVWLLPHAAGKGSSAVWMWVTQHFCWSSWPEKGLFFLILFQE